MRVTVHNGSPVAAEAVEVSVFAMPFNVGNVEAYDVLGTVVIPEVPAGGSEVAEFVWAPDGSYDHVCLRAVITPNNTQDDQLNNMAQSNYVGLSSGSSSPADLNTLTVTLANAFDQGVTAFPIVDVHETRFRVFLDRRSVELNAGASEQIQVRYQFVGDFAEEYGETLFDVPQSNVDFTAEFDRRVEDTTLSVPSFEGATVNVRAGFKTYVGVDNVPPNNPNEPIAFVGDVLRVTDDSPVPDGGKLLACIWRGGNVADLCELVEVHGGEWEWRTVGPWTKASFEFTGHDEDLASPSAEVSP